MNFGARLKNLDAMSSFKEVQAWEECLSFVGVSPEGIDWLQSTAGKVLRPASPLLQDVQKYLCTYYHDSGFRR